MSLSESTFAQHYPSPAYRPPSNGGANKLQIEDKAAHNWYRFVLSFPPHLVRDYVARFGLKPGMTLLDPFCGTGTTIVECKKLGINGIGLEASPMAHFAASVKANWDVSPERLLEHSASIAASVEKKLESQGFNSGVDGLFARPAKSTEQAHLMLLPPDQMKLLLRDSISPLPLHRVLTLLDRLALDGEHRHTNHQKLAIAKAVITDVGNLHFGPEVGVGPPKKDAPAIDSWLRSVENMVRDIKLLRPFHTNPVQIIRADARQLDEVLPPNSIDAVITSPPYPNEKDYTRTTRLESVLLGFVRNKVELRLLKGTLMRSNTRGVYVNDDDDQWIKGHPEIERIAEEIEKRRIDMKKTSGFERMYARVTRLYFGGMARHLMRLRTVLRPGAQLAYVVGDQASYLRVMIRTGQLLADIAQSIGYEVLGIDLFRTRLATATREQLREEVLVLRWPGKTRE
jgi:hypothetical protein